MEDLTSYGLVEQPTSGGSQGTTTTYIFSGISRGKAKAALIALLNSSDTLPMFRGMPILSKNCSIAFNGFIETLTIVTGIPSFSSGSPSESQDLVEWNLNTNRIEKAIETHKNYKVCWSRDLYYAVPATAANPNIPALPAWYTDNKTPATGDIYWSADKNHPSDVVIGGLPHRFVLAAVRTKMGIEVYQVNAPIVTEYKYFKSISSAKKNLKIANKLLAPDETFDYPKSAKCWLVNPDGISQEGDYYVTRNVYQYADEWDGDIYDEA